MHPHKEISIQKYIMYKFALLQNVSFNFSNSLNTLTNETIKQYISDKFELFAFDNSKELFTSIHEILGKGIYEIINCYYDESVLIQAIFLEDNVSENYKKLILVKRKIHENDTYTFLEFDPTSNTEKYQYETMIMDDVVNVVMDKNLNKGVYVHSNKQIDNVLYYDKTESNQLGTLVVLHDGNVREFKYLNLVNIMQEVSDKNLTDDEFTETLKTRLDESGADYLYTQKDFGLGLLNCYYQTFGFTKNEIISKLIKEDISGDVIIGLENKLNDDSRLLGITKDTFKKIIELTQNTNFKVKNGIFCNVYYELANM